MRYRIIKVFLGIGVIVRFKVFNVVCIVEFFGVWVFGWAVLSF